MRRGALHFSELITCLPLRGVTFLLEEFESDSFQDLSGGVPRDVSRAVRGVAGLLRRVGVQSHTVWQHGATSRGSSGKWRGDVPGLCADSESAAQRLVQWSCPVSPDATPPPRGQLTHQERLDEILLERAANRGTGSCVASACSGVRDLPWAHTAAKASSLSLARALARACS